MLFNSFLFLQFFLLVYAGYLLTQKRLRLQNLILLAASLWFYGTWSLQFLGLMLFSTFVDYFVAVKLGEVSDSKKRKKLLIVSLTINLLILGVFKYFNFFADNVAVMMRAVGMEPDFVTLNIILPVGISFYTFQAMGYVIDVYRKQLAPCRDFVDYLLFITFFPQLVAGPIERAPHLLKQVTAPRRITSSGISAGIFLILLGYFKKVVLADNVSVLANSIFNNYPEYKGLDLVLGTVAFGFQIYGDFSGYSDIARGLCYLMGFDLMVNFNLPYFAVNPRDLWARWHISLSTWLRDYLYIPLGGSDPARGPWFKYRNLMITMLLSGLWHGASWNFVMWGAYHGVLLILYMRFADIWDRQSMFIRMPLMFALTMFGWILFRAHNPEQIMYFLQNISWRISPQTLSYAMKIGFFVGPLLLIEAAQYKNGNQLWITHWKAAQKITVYSLLLIWIIIFGYGESVEFIYFQF